MNLIPVDTYPADAFLLYKLLAEREPHQSISHKAMPTMAQHLHFIASQPYMAWNIIKVDSVPIGAIYLTHQREIGVGILKKHQRKGYAREAIRLLRKDYPGQYFANINPANAASIKLFADLGFVHIQNTYTV